jgi:hypothetical protein
MLTVTPRHIARFDGGGYVIHKISVGKGRASAWFDAAHNLLDVEQFNARGISQRVSAKTRAFIAEYGPIWEGQDRRNVPASHRM